MSEHGYRPVKLKDFELATNRYRDGKSRWSVTGLIERAKNLPVFDLPLCAVYAGQKIWEPIESAYDLAKHMRRVMDADLAKPVILDEEGFVMDGWHRIARALMEGAATIPAVRFETTPPPDYVES